VRFGGEKRWQRERITNWKHEIFEYLRSSSFSAFSESYKALQVSNEDIKMLLEELQPVTNDKSYLSPLLFSSFRGNLSYINSPGGTLIKLREKKEKGGVVKRWAGDRNHYSSLEQVLEKKITNADFEYGAIAVKPGMYKILFNSVYGSPPSGYYGKSSIVEIKQGERVVIQVPLIPAI